MTRTIPNFARNSLLRSVGSKRRLERDDLVRLLAADSPEDTEAIRSCAYAIKLAEIGPNVYLRGLIEVSNICAKNCGYCGIRKDNRKIRRFQLTRDEIVEAAMLAHHNRYGSIVLQAGERQDESFVAFIESTIREIRFRTHGHLGITLSLGEQSNEAYARWRDAGAHRYLLRIETSSERLYRQLHPVDHRFGERLRCLGALRNLGYQVGTGVLIGLPSQTVEDLADDLLFFREHDVDMIGMGPYVVHAETPLGAVAANTASARHERLQRALRMISVARILLRDVNIASTTALQALDPNGRELGLLAGANVMMPNVSASEHRAEYALYEGKPGVLDTPDDARRAMETWTSKTGERIAYGEWGDSPHARQRLGT